jgi:hypothetical protein
MWILLALVLGAVAAASLWQRGREREGATTIILRGWAQDNGQPPPAALIFGIKLIVSRLPRRHVRAILDSGGRGDVWDEALRWAEAHNLLDPPQPTGVAHSPPGVPMSGRSADAGKPAPQVSQVDLARQLLAHHIPANVAAGARVFMTAALLPVWPAGLNRSREQKLVTCAFLWGAVDAVAHHAGLSEHDALPIVFDLCRDLIGASVTEVGELTGEIVKGLVHRPGFVDGGEAILDWLSKKDETAPGRLISVLRKVKPAGR